MDEFRWSNDAHTHIHSSKRKSTGNDEVSQSETQCTVSYNRKSHESSHN